MPRRDPDVLHIDHRGRVMILDDGQRIPITNITHGEEDVSFDDLDLYTDVVFIGGPTVNGKWHVVPADWIPEPRGH